jgi:uncharacterized LabA/DUF88 family protein
MTATKVMVLIDADNVTGDVIEQALERVVEAHGAAHVRRAYCTAEAAVKQHKLFQKLSVRPMVNIASGKNCTDIALSIDAIDLAIAESPDVMVIVSSDSDFAPLVLRLREKGCRVEGYGQEGKVSDDTRPVYDAYFDLPHRKARATRPAAKSTRAARPAAAPRAAAAPKAPPPPLPDEVRQILQAMPALRAGEWVALQGAAEPLRNAGLLSNRSASTKVFKKHAALFELAPDRQPSKVRFLGG